MGSFFEFESNLSKKDLSSYPVLRYYVFGLLNFLNIFPRYFLNSTILIANESFPIFHILILIILVAFFVVLQFFLFLNFSRKGPIFVERSD